VEREERVGEGVERSQLSRSLSEGAFGSFRWWEIRKRLTVLGSTGGREVEGDLLAGLVHRVLDHGGGEGLDREAVAWENERVECQLGLGWEDEGGKEKTYVGFDSGQEVIKLAAIE
jgi:hypothetical protein